jgi:tetratricopeptide (TPR) repeat protein
MIFILSRFSFISITQASQCSAAYLLAHKCSSQSQISSSAAMEAQATRDIAKLTQLITQDTKRPAEKLQHTRWMKNLAELHLMHDNRSAAQKWIQNAIKDCETLLSIDANSPFVRHAHFVLPDLLTTLAACQQQVDPSIAIHTYQKALHLNEKNVHDKYHHSNWPYHVHLALAFMACENYRSSYAIYDLYPKIFPKEIKSFRKREWVEEALTNQAIIAMWDNKPEHALSLCHCALEKLPSEPCVGTAILHFNLHCIYEMLEQQTSAHKHYLQAIHRFGQVITNIATHPLHPLLFPSVKHHALHTASKPRLLL